MLTFEELTLKHDEVLEQERLLLDRLLKNNQSEELKWIVVYIQDKNKPIYTYSVWGREWESKLEIQIKATEDRIRLLQYLVTNLKRN